MMKTFRIIALILMMTMLLGILAGCGAINREPEPDTTSSELGLFVKGRIIYNAKGEVVTDYTIDEKGNIRDQSGKMVIAARNVEGFSQPYDAVVDPECLSQTIPGEEMEDGTVMTQAAPFTIRFDVEPAFALANVVSVESGEPGMLYFPYAQNKSVLDSSTKDPGDDMLSVAYVKPNRQGRVEMTAVALFEGEVDISVRNGAGDLLTRFTVTITADLTGELDLSEADGQKTDKPSKTADHEHEFATRYVGATYKTGGFTVHTCKICGFSYRDEYTDKLPHDHQYVDKVVEPTLSAGGYTLHTCTICGESYQDNETEPLPCSHEHMRTTEVAATCTSGGYTLHECTDCGRYSYTDNETPAIPHSYTVTETVAPTCGAAGYTVHTCSMCGDSFQEAGEPATGAHSYTETVVAPTTESGGYTLHTCTVCGDSYQDNFTDPLVSDITEPEQPEG